MSYKAILLGAAGALLVTPALAASSNWITHHTGGPIPYSQLQSMDAGRTSHAGYRYSRHHRRPRLAQPSASAAESPVVGNPAADASANAAGADTTANATGNASSITANTPAAGVTATTPGATTGATGGEATTPGAAGAAGTAPQ